VDSRRILGGFLEDSQGILVSSQLIRCSPRRIYGLVTADFYPRGGARLLGKAFNIARSLGNER
jgi:hypothetical protein